LTESNILRDDLGAKIKEISTLKETTAFLLNQLQVRLKEIIELKKEKDAKLLLETKIGLLEKQIEEKNGQNFQMSKVINEVQAEREFLYKKVDNLEQELEKEHNEKENLQQSIVSLQYSHRMDTASRKSDVLNGHFCEEPFVVEKPGSINFSDLPQEGQRWHIELEALESMGYKDRTKNIELLNKYQDVTQVVSDLHKIGQVRVSSVPEKTRELPSDIAEVEIQMLEAMGFHDLEKNIGLLRKHKDVSLVVEILLSTQLVM